MMLSAIALVNDVEGLDAIPKTYNTIALRVGSRSIRFTFIAILVTETYSPGRVLIEVYV